MESQKSDPLMESAKWVADKLQTLPYVEQRGVRYFQGVFEVTCSTKPSDRIKEDMQALLSCHGFNCDKLVIKVTNLADDNGNPIVFDPQV